MNAACEMECVDKKYVCIDPAGFKPTGYFFAHFQNKKSCRITKNLLQ